MGQTQTKTCAECKNQAKCKPCLKCEFSFCSNCLSHPLIYLQKDNERAKYKVEDVCLTCFKKNTKLDFSKYYTIEGQQNKNGIQILFLHGVGGTRNMFMHQAKVLAKQKGYRCILIDLPKHGALMNQDLTIESCMRLIQKTKKQLCHSNNVYLVGGSYGGYLSMVALGYFPQMFKGGVIMMSGFDIGEGRKIMGKIGVFAIQTSSSLLSQKTMIKQMVDQAFSNKNLDSKMMEQILQAGLYFNKAQQPVKAIKEVNLQQSLKQAKCPILFMNGQKDFRDAEEKFLKASPQKSQLKVFKDTDHFFSHDKRYFGEVVNQIDIFIKKLQK